MRYRDFRLLWVGQLVSTAGTQMTHVAIAWQLYELTGSELSLGLIGLARLIPLLLFSLGSGVLADAFDRRKLMLLSQSTMLVLSAALAVVTALGLAQPWLILMFIALSSIASTFDLPARQAIVPSLVPRERLGNALSLMILAWQTATIVGPTLAGLLIAVRGGADVVYAVDALSFAGVITALLLIRTRHVPPERRNVSIGAAVDGLRFVWGTPILFWTMALDFVATFFAGAMTLLPVFAKDVLLVGPEGLGILYAAPSIGAVVAGGVAAWLGTINRQGATLLVAVALYGVFTIVFGVSQSFWLSALMLAGIGASDTISMVIRNTLRQSLTPDSLRGRMVAVNQLFFAGGPQLGEVEAGVVAQRWGAPLSVWSGGLACVLAVGLLALGVPGLRNYRDNSATQDQPREEPAAEASSATTV